MRRMIEKFKPGDVVELKSGGPLMTVNYVETGMCEVVWFPDMAGSHGTAKFPATTLEKRDPPKPARIVSNYIE